ncbi:MAG TPA: SDR family oxidoreductase [Pyrinomonadaceae bacterium]|nr:SDR family oxidoreductase [Pyrinomonadaceae bacterium]
MHEKVAVITGATSGIGRASASLFAGRGFSVAAVGRNEGELDAFNAEEGGFIRGYKADVASVDDVDRVVSEIFVDHQRVDVLVNAAGIIKNGSIESTSLADWDEMLDINLRSVFYLMQKFIPHLQETRGNIVNVSSVTGTRAFPNVLAYCVSKAGVDQLTRCAALELAPKGVRVNAVNPGVVITNLHKRGGMPEGEYEKFVENAGSTHPIGRAGNPEEVAELIYFLASEKAAWITGATYEIDGGRAQTCAR